MDRETLAASVAGMAARLRIQLSNLTAASQMLERTATGEKAGAYLAVLNQSICRMLRSVGQMELLDRLTDEDEIRAFPAPVDLGPWSAQLAARARGVLGGAGVSLSYQGPERLLAHVDQDLAEQMVLSLVACAARPGGEVSITLTQQEDSACFTVRGPGPARPGEELIQRLSAPGQAELAEGWELPLARQIAELHAGSLVEQRAPGERLSLVALLPLGLGRPTGRLESPAPAYDPGGFDEALVAFSELLPPESFRPEELG